LFDGYLFSSLEMANGWNDYTEPTESLLRWLSALLVLVNALTEENTTIDSHQENLDRFQKCWILTPINHFSWRHRKDWPSAAPSKSFRLCHHYHVLKLYAKYQRQIGLQSGENILDVGVQIQAPRDHHHPTWRTMSNSWFSYATMMIPWFFVSTRTSTPVPRVNGHAGILHTPISLVPRHHNQ
jgi:hypothetical protein